MRIRGYVRSSALVSVITVILSIGMGRHAAAASEAEGKSQADGARAPALNLFETHKEEYVTPDAPAIVNVASAKYLALRGVGEPGGEEFRRKVGMIYGVAFMIKGTQAQKGHDFVVSSLEGLWWAEGENVDFLKVPKTKWQWKLLIRVPEFVTKKEVAAFAGWAGRPSATGKPQSVELETLEEGKCVQVLHVGPYSNENATIAEMRRFAKSKGLTENGVHHEIYLDDPNKTPPEKLRTILRQPVK